MNIPTKTGLQIFNECVIKNGNIPENIFKEWVLLEDYQKEIERREQLREQYYDGWLSPEQLKEIVKDIIAFSVTTNSRVELQCKIINSFNVLFDAQSPNQCKPSREAVKDKPSQEQLGDVTTQPVGVSSLPKITRVELITQKGRKYVTWKATNVQISIQDNERTLKVFMEDEKIRGCKKCGHKKRDHYTEKDFKSVIEKHGHCWLCSVLYDNKCFGFVEKTK